MTTLTGPVHGAWRRDLRALCVVTGACKISGVDMREELMAGLMSLTKMMNSPKLLHFECLFDNQKKRHVSTLD